LKTARITEVQEQTYEIPVRRHHEWPLEVEGEAIGYFYIEGAEFANYDGITAPLIQVGAQIDPAPDYAGKLVLYKL
jgi:hypothetical protein